MRKTAVLVSLAALLCCGVVFFPGCAKDDNPVKSGNDAPVNNAPAFTINFDSTVLVREGVLYRDSLSATDPEGGALTYTLVNGPAGMTVVDGIVSWTPSVLGLDTVSVKVADGDGAADTLIWYVYVRKMIVSDSMKSNHYVPDFYLHYDYADTIWTDMKGDSFYFIDSTKGMSLSFAATDSFCLVRWTYDSGTVNGGTKYDDFPGGVLHASVVAVRQDIRDTIAWTVNLNTTPWIETSQYQVTTRVYLGNSYTDTVMVSDIDGDKPRFTVTDTGGLGVHITGVEQTGDTTLCFIAWNVTKTGSFGVSIGVDDSIFGYDTALALIFLSTEKKLIVSNPAFMKYGTPVDSVYKDTIGIFDEYRSGFTGSLLRGPAGMTLADSIITWTPASAAEETVSVRFAHASYEKGADTLTWVVRAVGLSKYVFWNKALTNGYNLQEANPGPGLPADLDSVFEGVVAGWVTRLCCGENNTGFNIGNGTWASGRSTMVYFHDLCDLQGTAVKAVIRGEFADGWSGNAFNNAGELRLKVGVIDLTLYRDMTKPFGYAGAIPCSSYYAGVYPVWNNPWSYNMKFYYNPITKVGIPGLMAEQLVVWQGPDGRPAEDEPSTLDGRFFEADVTPQVQWILNQRGRDYVETGKAGDYAIVMLTPNDMTAGGNGKVNLYAAYWGSSSIGAASDNPWTRDGNTVHLYVEGDLSTAQ